MVEEKKYCYKAMKKCFNKKPVMTKEYDGNFGGSTKFCFCDNAQIDGDVKVEV